MTDDVPAAADPAAVEAHVDEAALVALVRAAIAVPSLSGAESAYAELVADRVRAWGWSVDRLPVHTPGDAGPRDNLLIHPWAPTGDRPVLAVNGHLDVVPPGPDAGWPQGGPWSGALVDGRIHGRGAVDTKGPTMASLHAARAVQRAGTEPAYDLVFHLVVGEERDGAGTQAALAQWPRPDAALVLEPTGGEVVAACTGLVAFDLDVFGTAAHTSSPWHGADAFTQAIAIHAELSAVARDRSARLDSSLLALLPEPMPFVVGLVEAGTYRNAVPDHARLSGRFGTAPGESAAHAVAVMEAAIARADAAVGWERASRLTVFHALPGWATDPEENVVRRLCAGVGADAGPALPVGRTAGSDAGYYGEAGIPTVLFGPGEMGLAHTPGESIAVRELVEGAAALVRAWSR